MQVAARNALHCRSCYNMQATVAVEWELIASLCTRPCAARLLVSEGVQRICLLPGSMGGRDPVKL
jgi:hypothetical protein